MLPDCPRPTCRTAGLQVQCGRATLQIGTFGLQSKPCEAEVDQPLSPQAGVYVPSGSCQSTGHHTMLPGGMLQQKRLKGSIPVWRCILRVCRLNMKSCATRTGEGIGLPVQDSGILLCGLFCFLFFVIPPCWDEKHAHKTNPNKFLVQGTQPGATQSGFPFDPDANTNQNRNKAHRISTKPCFTSQHGA